MMRIGVASRHDHESSSATLGGHRVAVQRLRMHATVMDFGELPVSAYELFSSTEGWREDSDRAADSQKRGVDFLGFHHRLVRSQARRGPRITPTWPVGPHARRCSTPETASGS